MAMNGFNNKLRQCIEVLGWLIDSFIGKFRGRQVMNDEIESSQSLMRHFHVEVTTSDLQKKKWVLGLRNDTNTPPNAIDLHNNRRQNIFDAVVTLYVPKLS